jgi:O-antigen/teichoic acid export membrane protein
MRIGQTSFITFVSKLVSSVVGFAATLYFANILGPGILGNYYLLLSVVSWLSLLGTMGVGNAITKRISEGESPGAYRVAGGVMLLSLMTVIVLGLFVFQDYIEQYLSLESIEFVVLLLIVGLFSSYVSAMLQGSHLVHVDSVLRPIRNLSRAGLQIVGVFLGFGLIALVYGYAAGSVVLIGIGLYVLGGPYERPSKRHFSSLIDYAKYAWMGKLEGRTFYQADILLLGVFVSTGVVGVYGIAWSLASFLIVFSTSITSAVFPRMSKLSSEENFEQVAVLAEDSLSYAGLITIPGLVGGVLLDDRILRLYGEGFGRGTEVLGLLIGAVLFYGYKGQFTTLLRGIDQPRDALKVNSVLIGSNIVLNVVLISQFGMIGAAVASISSTFLGALTGYSITQRYIPVNVPARLISKQIVAAVGMGGVVLVLEQGVGRLAYQPPNWVLTGTLILLGACVYFGSLFVISWEFRATVSENVLYQLPFVKKL